MKNNDRIWLSPPHMGGKEIKYIEKAFQENWVAPLGPNVDGFERDLGIYLENEYITALNSGTAAIHLALIMLSVKPGDYVLAPSFTFSATINPIFYQGARPILIDSETETWNMDPVLLEKAIVEAHSKNIFPKALILVHLYGMPSKLNEILRISRKYNIPVIEDAAEALGSKYKGKKLGTFGTFGILSFNGNKIITTSGGGALICKNQKDAEYSKFLATQARDNAEYYQHSCIGYNYRMSNITAGIGRGQMEVLKNRISRRREINNVYRKGLKKISGIKFLEEPSIEYLSNFWLTSIVIEKENCGFSNKELRIELEKENIETRYLWKPMHLQPIFQNEIFYSKNVSEKLFNRGLCLPSGSNLTNDDLNRIINIIIRFYNR